MTAWVTPAHFGHGDYPTAANLNKISTGQTSINERKPNALFAPCTPKLSTGEQVAFWHQHRYLHYKSTGTIIDPSGIEEDVSLPNPSDDWFNVYDLDSVSWLSYGALYYVQGVDFVTELETG